MTQSVLHIVFTPSGAGSLRQALKNAGRDDEVISFFDDLSLGPINAPDSSLRSKWAENELGRTERDDITAESERFWSEALSLKYRKVAWLSRRSAMEYAGFLEWVWRLGDVACELVDLTEVTISRPPQHGPALPPAPALCVGLLSPDTIGKNDLWDLAEPLQMAVRDRYRDLWRQLRKENAPLRVLAGDTFVSAPISFFDSLLMSHVTDDWRKVAKIVGLVLAAQMDKRIFQTGDIFLAARINALAESSRFEIRGKSALEMHFSEVRLPKSPG